MLLGSTGAEHKVEPEPQASSALLTRVPLILQVEQRLQVSCGSGHRLLWQHVLHGGHRHLGLLAHRYVFSGEVGERWERWE